MLSDREAIKAIDRLCAVSRNLDHIGLREWVAAHCGLNPHAAGPLDPDAAVVAERDKLAASLAALRDKADRLAAYVRNLDGRNAELKAALAGAKNDAKTERKARLEAGKPVDNDPQPANKRKAARKAYQRELMRKRRAEKRQSAAV